MPADPQEIRRSSKRQKPLPKVSNEMPTEKSSDIPPDFTKRCHYILQIYTCGHKTWLNKPRIQHMHPFCMFAYMATEGDKTKSDVKYRFHKLRCTNMSTQPKELHMAEVCAKCRPIELGVAGVTKQLREYESLVDGKGQTSIGEGKVEQSKENNDGLAKQSKEDAGVAQTDENIGKDAEGNAESKPSTENDGELWKTVKEWPSKQVDDNATDSETPLARSVFGSFIGMFMPAAKPQESKSDDNDEPLEIWIEVEEEPEQPDLWEDDGEWVNIYGQ
ncbi:uncharacterized protein LY89DRAFT_729988 [Mollisia scopiformis]|uniref:Uncharacterized protein n=1 Tax=Mollisia scopiformis TaxID=149040 RepID=A0A194XN59_MOLSC|nr:uncharacterized protein LY89DRAFT_729988 [Mollisia scopiformis]KUJ21197.1 hypothetical protein LY89DRAFT_729988 [Mollisia scopiformis]